jgi:hypothetical protein
MALTYASYGGVDWTDNGQTTYTSGLTSVTVKSTSDVYVGKGMFLIKLLIYEIEKDTGDELYTFDVMANTNAAATTWKTLGPGVTLGASALTHRDAANSANLPSAVVFAVMNPYDNEVHLRLGVDGTVASGINFNAVVYPMNVHP